MKSKQDKGFTLVEVMVALAVVALVSTPLLQMFVTTSYVNKEAQVTDRLNVIAVQKAETFKADPEAVYDPDQPDYYYFYTRDVTPILPYQDFCDLEIIPDGAAFMIKSHLPDPIYTPSNDGGYYPDFAMTLDLADYPLMFDFLPEPEPLTMIIENDPTGQIGVKLAGKPFEPLDSSKIKNNILPFRIDFPTGEEQRTIKLKLTNVTEVEAELYVYNTKVDENVKFETVLGASSIAYVHATSADNKEYDLTLTANRLSKGVWVDMFTYLANKHIYN